MTASGGDRRPWRVVIVSDDDDCRARLQRLLQLGSDRGYEFVEADTGAKALAAIGEEPNHLPRCVLLDDTLPDMTATDLLRSLTDSDAQTVCPVMVMTGTAGQEEGREVLQAGAQDFVGKDALNASSLTRALENAVERYGLTREIHARELAIRESEARLRLALEASRTGLWTWDMMTDAVTWSPEVYQLLELDPGASQPSGALFFSLIHPGDRQRVQDSVWNAIKRHELYACEFRMMRKSGAVLWVENRGSARYGAAGEPISMIGTVTDVSARKRAEGDLQRRELELRTLADNTPDILTRFDRQLRHVFVNAAVERATGRPRSDFIGKTNRELGMPGELCDRWDAALHAAFETGQLQAIAFSYPGPQGTQFYTARLVPEADPDGLVSYVLGVTHDVTARERYEQSLLDASRRKNEFLAMLAHELRNPLAPLRTGIQVLRLAQSDSKVSERAFDAMERQLSHMVRLVDDLLDVSRISRGSVELKRESIQLRTVVEHAVESSRPAIDARQHQLQIDIPAHPVWIDGDLTRLAQVLSNLLNNAAKYTSPKGRIGLMAALDATDVVVRVVDDGAGISAEELPRVFELFAQVGATLDRAQGGLGIGLALVRQLIELHGGSVKAESAGLGKGSCFTVRVPSIPPPASEQLPADLERQAAPNRAKVQRRRVLVVDDNVDSAQMLAEMLELMGHEARMAHDGASAIAAARALAPELVFLDLGLPEMDGYEVARQIRSARAIASGGLLVALTGWGRAEDKRRTEEAGFDMHLTKPVEPGTIGSILHLLR